MSLRSMVHGFRIQSATNQDFHPFFTPEVYTENAPMNFTTKSLLVPMVSAANVPQLAVDILIASLSLSRLGTFDSRYIVPVVGGREDGEDGVTTPIELFGKEGLDFVVIQQRSPVLRSRKNEFISSIIQFVQDSGFKSLLFLSSLDLTNRTDSQMSTPIYHILPKTSASLEGTALTSLTSLPQYISTSSQDPSVPSFSGGGLTRRIFSSIPREWSLPTGFLLIFALEGDNRADATLLAVAIENVLVANRTIREWREPQSWGHGLFGPVHDQTLFG